MKQRLIILVNLSMIALFLISGCNKIDLGERSKITISGNTSEVADFNMTYEVFEGVSLGSIGNDCLNVIHASAIQLNLQPEATLEVHLLRSEWDEYLPEGNFDVISNECEEGITAFFTAPAQGKAINVLTISSGTMRIRNDEGTYDINIDFRISAASGGGTMKGNFTGMLVQAE